MKNAISGIVVIILLTGCANNSSYSDSATMRLVEARNTPGTAEHKAFQIRLAEAKRKREKAEKDPSYMARINKLKKIDRKNKAKQEKINNDPQVIAARIQARAINAQIRAQQQQARTESYQRTMDRIQAQNQARNAQTNYNTQQMLNRMNTSNQSTDSIINPSNNKFYMHSDGTSTRKVGNTYYHSNGTTTTAY